MADTQNTQPNIENAEMRTPAGFEAKHHGHVGPILGVLVIMLVLILGGLYLWGSMLSQDMATPPTPTPVVNNEPETPRAEADVQILETLSPSDELDAISADLSATNLGSLDSDITAIDAELNAALAQ